MALSTELLKRLNSDEEPLPKRLKVAENAFHTVDLPIVRKEDLILQWLCKVCSVDENVWSSLRHCLQTERIDIKVNVKKLLIDKLLRKLKENPENQISDDVLKCCDLLVSNTGMQQYFVNEPKDLCLLIKSLLDYVIKLFESTFNIKVESTEGISIALINDGNGSTLLAYNTIISVIESMMQIFKSSHAAKKHLRNEFIQNILYPLCAIIDHNCVSSVNRLGAIVHKCVQQLIFEKRHMQKKLLTNEEDAVVFTQLLAEKAKTENVESNRKTFIFIFRAAIGIYKSDGIVLDLIFRELIQSAGVHKKEILSSLLKYLNDITLDFDNKVNGVTLFEYCRNIIDTISLNDNLATVDYVLLTQFFYFNPLMVEKMIQDILKKVFLERSTSKCVDLLVAMLDASVRLRREEKLIVHILTAVKHSSNQLSSKKVEFLPAEFKDKLVKSVNNITNSQGVVMLRTLVFHLNTDCTEVLESNDSCKNIIVMKATVELLVALLNGICIFEYTGTLTSHQNFINALIDLGNALTVLVDKALHLSYNEHIILLLLTAIESWSEAQNALKYYVPQAFTREFKFPISEDHWQQLIQRVTNFGKEHCKNCMNKLILRQLRMSENIATESINLTGLIGGLDSFWSCMLKSNTEMISFLCRRDTERMACLLLADMVSNKDNFDQWVLTLNKECVQENKRFVTSLLSCVLIEIGCLATDGMTKSIGKHLDMKSLVEAETVGTKKINKIIQALKDELSSSKWTQLKGTVLYEIETRLKILNHIPLIFLSTNVKLVTFMTVYAVRKECDVSEQVTFVCNEIISDLLEKSSFDIFNYIDPLLLINQSTQTKIFQKAIERSFKNGLSYAVLKSLIKSANRKETMYLLLDCIENAKTKLSVEQKTVFKKAENKLTKIILKNLITEITEANDVKTLTLIVKISIANKKVTTDLKNLAESTLHDIFVVHTDFSQRVESELLDEGLQLAIVILRNLKEFEVTSETIKGLWAAMLASPCEDLLSPLFESSSPSEFNELLGLLHSKMTNSISNIREDEFRNVCIIWNAMLKTNMSAERNKLRLTAIDKLFQTVHIVPISKNCWTHLLKLLQQIFATKHLHTAGSIIDMSIVICLKSLAEIQILACHDALALCGILLKVRTSLITDRLPPLLLLYRRILSVIVHTSKTIDNKSEEHMLRCLALDIEKFTNSLVKLKKDMIRLSPYLVADLLEQISKASSASFVKASVQNCMGQLIGICDQHGIALLSRTLPIPLQETFKNHLDVFNKFHKFSGKI